MLWKIKLKIILIHDHRPEMTAGQSYSRSPNRYATNIYGIVGAENIIESVAQW